MDRRGRTKPKAFRQPSGDEIYPDEYGNINIHNNDHFSLSCEEDRAFTEERLRRENQIDVTCVDSHLDVQGQSYEYDDFECGDMENLPMWELEDDYEDTVTTMRPDASSDEHLTPPDHLPAGK